VQEAGKSLTILLNSGPAAYAVFFSEQLRTGKPSSWELCTLKTRYFTSRLHFSSISFHPLARQGKAPPASPGACYFDALELTWLLWSTGIL